MSYGGDYSLVNNVVGGGQYVFTEGRHYSPVNNVLGGYYSLVNIVWGDILWEDILWEDTVHYDNGMCNYDVSRVNDISKLRTICVVSAPFESPAIYLPVTSIAAALP